jgi:aminomethyltransferase
MKRTPLFETHRKLGGKLVEFGGWEMPVQYTSIMDEHTAVRTAAGLFDISHMGEVLVSGGGAEEFLNRTLTNDIRKLTPGLGQYTLMCNEAGGTVDDLYAYRLGPDDYLMIINASRITDDVAWLEKRMSVLAGVGRVNLRNMSDRMGAVAVQGPKVIEFINDSFPGSSKKGTKVEYVSALKKNEIAQFVFGAEDIWISRTGYTGEDGFEIVSNGSAIVGIWDLLLKTGQPYGLKPAGLGARDTLRTEACYPLYGNELDEKTSPIEAGVGYFVSLDKCEFVGKPLMAKQRASGTSRKLVAFKMAEKCAPPRPHYPIWAAGAGANRLGDVTSGTQSPTLGIGIGLGYVPAAMATPDTPIAIEIRGKNSAAVVVRKPFYRKAG